MWCAPSRLHFASSLRVFTSRLHFASSLRIFTSRSTHWSRRRVRTWLLHPKAAQACGCGPPQCSCLSGGGKGAVGEASDTAAAAGRDDHGDLLGLATHISRRDSTGKGDGPHRSRGEVSRGPNSRGPNSRGPRSPTSRASKRPVTSRAAAGDCHERTAFRRDPRGDGKDDLILAPYEESYMRADRWKGHARHGDVELPWPIGLCLATGRDERENPMFIESHCMRAA